MSYHEVFVTPRQTSSIGSPLFGTTMEGTPAVRTSTEQSGLGSHQGVYTQQNNPYHGGGGSTIQSSGQQLLGQQLSGQQLSKQQLLGQQLSGQQFLGQQFSGQQLSGQQLSGQQLSGQQLSGQQLLGQQLSGQQLSGQQHFSYQSEMVPGQQQQFMTHESPLVANYQQLVMAQQPVGYQQMQIGQQAVGATYVDQNYGGQNVVREDRYAQYAQQSAATSHYSAIGGEVVKIERKITTGNPVVVAQNRIESPETSRILREYDTEMKVSVPKVIIREEVFETSHIQQDIHQKEEMSEVTYKIRERQVTRAARKVIDKVIEQPEIEIIERTVEIPEVHITQKIVQRPMPQAVQPTVMEAPRVEIIERIVQVPEIEWRTVPIEKIVEVKQIRKEVTVEQVPVPQHVEKRVPEYKTVEVVKDVRRNVPVPVEAISTYEFKLPRLKPKYNVVDVPLYIPRFVEIPFPIDSMDLEVAKHAEVYTEEVASLIQRDSTSLCEIEKLAESIKKTDFKTLVSRQDCVDTVYQAWQSGRLRVDEASWNSLQTTVATRHTGSRYAQRKETKSDDKTVSDDDDKIST